MPNTVFSLVVIGLLVLGTGIAGCTSVESRTSQVPAVPLAATQSSWENSATPNLTGVWKGTTVGHTEKEGFVEYPVATYNITEQKGPAFAGQKEYPRMDGKTYHENFSGIVTKYNEVFIGDNNTGFIEGRLTGPDSIEIYYIDDGSDAKALIVDLVRQNG